MQPVSPELEAQALRLRASFLRAESRKNRTQADRAYGELWALCRSRLEANAPLSKYVSPKWPLEDLTQMLRLGLLEAARDYDPSRGVTFLACAMFMARKSLLGYVGEYNETIRQTPHVIRSRKILAEYSEALTLAEGREPTDEEIVNAALTPKDAQMARFAALNPVSTVTYELSSGGWHDIPARGDSLADAVADAGLVESAWDAWLPRLTPHQAECLVQRYALDRSNAEAGEALGRETKSVDNAVTLAKATLRALAEAELAERGLTIATATPDDLLGLRLQAVQGPS